MMEIKLSSFKRDHGLKELLSDDLSEFWHTDSSLPHFIEIYFHRVAFVSEIVITLLYSKDDSYTPSSIEVRFGMTRYNMRSINNDVLTEPEANHQDGKDTHIRKLVVLDENKNAILPIAESLERVE